nr:uncharacterized protein LOC101040354 [Saimiri boliviensis boliviensis]
MTTPANSRETRATAISEIHWPAARGRCRTQRALLPRRAPRQQRGAARAFPDAQGLGTAFLAGLSFGASRSPREKSLRLIASPLCSFNLRNVEEIKSSELALKRQMKRARDHCQRRTKLPSLLHTAGRGRQTRGKGPTSDPDSRAPLPQGDRRSGSAETRPGGAGRGFRGPPPQQVKAAFHRSDCSATAASAEIVLLGNIAARPFYQCAGVLRERADGSKSDRAVVCVTDSGPLQQRKTQIQRKGQVMHHRDGVCKALSTFQWTGAPRGKGKCVPLCRRFY